MVNETKLEIAIYDDSDRKAVVQVRESGKDKDIQAKCACCHNRNIWLISLPLYQQMYFDVI